MKTSFTIFKYHNFFSKAYLISSEALAPLAAIILNIILLHNLPRDDYGAFVYCYAVAAIVSMIASLGVGQFILKSHFDNPEKELVPYIFIIIMLGATFCSIVIGASFVIFHTTQELWIMALLLTQMPFVICREILFSIAQIKDNLKLIRIVNTIIPASKLIIFLIMFQVINLKQLVYLAPLTYAVINFIFIASVSWYLYNRHGHLLNLKYPITKSSIKYYTQKIFPFAIVVIAANIYLQLDTVIIKIVLGNVFVSEYNVSKLVISAVALAPHAIFYRLFTMRYYQDASDNRHYFVSKTLKLTPFYIIVGSCCALVLFINSPNITLLMTGTENEMIVSQMKLFSLALPFVFANSHLGLAINAIDNTTAKAKMMLSVAAFNVFLNFCLVFDYGVYGVIMVSVLGYFGLFILFTLKIKRHAAKC